jgi:hypothetical protein
MHLRSPLVLTFLAALTACDAPTDPGGGADDGGGGGGGGGDDGGDDDGGAGEGGGGGDGVDDLGTCPALDPDPGPATITATTCSPPPLVALGSIPDDPSLDDGDLDTKAIFEVEGGDTLVGKFVRDQAAAEGAMRLWQEIRLRIPANQLRDLVQFEVYGRTDPTALFNRTGDITTSRAGLKIGFSTQNFTRDSADSCAPLVPHRGTFDWSLIHEFGHLRGWVDGTWPEFLTAFTHVEGPGVNYPADGSPDLSRAYVTSYAERSDGDEDYAESFTTLMMLPASAIPAPSAGEPGATTKVRWIRDLPNFTELRKAIRVSEPDGGGGSVIPAPRLADGIHISPPSPFLGTWRESPTDGWQVTFSACDVTVAKLVGGVETERVSLAESRADSKLVSIDVVRATSEAYWYVAALHPGGQVLGENFSLSDGDVLFSRDDAFADVRLKKVP